jgi:hypothetical protein
MQIDPIAIVGVVVLTLLAVLLTGPGMWSDSWGWKWFGSGKRSGPEPREPVRRDAP